MSCTSRISATTHASARLSDGADGWIVATSFGDPPAEADACREGAGVADVSNWGAFLLSGANAVKFLQGLVTNDVASLASGEGCYAAFLNVHGRIESDVYIFRFDDGLVLHTPPETAAWVEKNLGRFRLAGGFDLERLGDGYAMISVLGPDSRQVLEKVTGSPSPGLSRCARSGPDTSPLRFMGIPRCASECTDVLGPEDDIARLWTMLVEAGASPVGSEALDVIRLEAGIARFGRDFDSDTVLQEVDCPEIVSFQKGCYLGQEIVARLHFQGQPSKLLRALQISGDILPEPGDEVVSVDDPAKPAGQVTSASSATRGGPTVLALVKRRYYAPGTAVVIRHGESTIPATVAERRPVARTGESE